MKRWRLLRNTWIDTRRNSFLPGMSRAEEAVMRHELRQELEIEFGARDIDAKVERFLEASPPWIRPIWPNLNPEHEIYNAYVLGAYYPALVGACCLGEAILNELVVRLREHFKNTPSYKKVYRKDSFQDWDLAISVLLEWEVFDTTLADSYRQLSTLRKQAAHPKVLSDVQSKSKEALKLYSGMMNKLFGPGENVVFWCPGEMYIKREKETDPLVIEFFIPSCDYVGFKHTIRLVNGGMQYVDFDDYEDKFVDDAEFRRLRIEWRESAKA
ncbi:MAG: hypothetical protein ABID84_00640 [Chloroflexota bacterium]